MTTWRRYVRRRDFVDAPISSNRVDKAKARVRHLAFDSFVFDQSRVVDYGVYAAIPARAKSIHVPSSYFGFQALNSKIGKHILVQIAIGMAEGRVRDARRGRASAALCTVGR